MCDNYKRNNYSVQEGRYTAYNPYYEHYEQPKQIFLRKNVGSCEKYVGSIEHLSGGSFSISAAVRPSNCSDCRYRLKPIMGVN